MNKKGFSKNKIKICMKKESKKTPFSWRKTRGLSFLTISCEVN